MRQLEVEALASHADGDPADSGPAREPGAEGRDKGGLTAAGVAEGERRKHREEDAAALGEVSGAHCAEGGLGSTAMLMSR